MSKVYTETPDPESNPEGHDVDPISGRDRTAGASDEVMAAVGPTQIEANDAAGDTAGDEPESDADALDAKATKHGKD